jgi:hypothetical protein
MGEQSSCRNVGAVRGRGTAELLASPVLAGSILVLLVNDHVLKAAWPGLVTGKLSDVAGVAMIAILAIAACRRVGLGVGATAVAFTLLKTVPAVASWSAPVLGGVTRTDPTDLIALVVLVPIARWARRSVTDGPPNEWAFPLRLLLVGAAVFATTATSCGVEGVVGVAVNGDRVIASTSAGVYESTDGGRTWVDSGLDSWEWPYSGLEFHEEVVCVPDGVCYEIVRPSEPGPTTRVDELRLGERDTVLDPSRGELDRLSDVVEPICGEEYLAAIGVVELADGPHVVVAMGEAGVLRSGPDGAWEWAAVGRFGLEVDQAAERPLGFGAASTAPNDPWEGAPYEIATVALLLVGPAVALTIAPVRQVARRRRRGAGGATAILTVGALVLLVLGLGIFALTGLGRAHQPRVVAAIALVAAALALVVLVAAWVGRPRPRIRWAAPRADHRVG